VLLSASFFSIFREYLGILLFICLPVIVLSAGLAIWLHYRQKRRKNQSDISPEYDTDASLISFAGPASITAVSPLEMEDRIGLARECRKQLSKSRAKYVALKHDFSVIQKNIVTIENNLPENFGRMDNLNEKIAAYEKQITDLQNKLEVLETVVPVQDETYYLRQALREKDNETVQLKQRVAELEGGLVHAEPKQEVLTTVNHLNPANSDLFRRIEHLQDEKIEQMKPGNEPQAEQRMRQGLTMQFVQKRQTELRKTIQRWLKDKEVNGDPNDTNYIFLRFVIDHLPKGLIGLLIAVIFLSAWGSIAASLNSLSSSTMNDLHKRWVKKPMEPVKEFRVSQYYTLFWGIFCVVVAQLAYNIGNSLIEAVNVLGSLFYGVILGIFLVAFYFKKISATPVFYSAVVVELFVIAIHLLNQNGIVNISFLWLNAIGALGVILLSLVIQRFRIIPGTSLVNTKT